MKIKDSLFVVMGILCYSAKNAPKKTKQGFPLHPVLPTAF